MSTNWQQLARNLAAAGVELTDYGKSLAAEGVPMTAAPEPIDVPAPIAATDPLLVQLRRVADARDAAAILVRQLDEKRAAFETENAGLIQLVADAKKGAEADEEQLRTLAVARYTETQNKAPAPGVSIKIIQKVDYPADAAFAWAKEMGMALMLDKKAFDAIAKTNPLDFVTRTTLATAAIAKDLHEAAAAAS